MILMRFKNEPNTVQNDFNTIYNELNTFINDLSTTIKSFLYYLYMYIRKSDTDAKFNMFYHIFSQYIYIYIIHLCAINESKYIYIYTYLFNARFLND